MPCKGIRSSQLIWWKDRLGTHSTSHHCNKKVDCVDGSDEDDTADCASRIKEGRIKEGIKMKVRSSGKLQDLDTLGGSLQSKH